MAPSTEQGGRTQAGARRAVKSTISCFNTPSTLDGEAHWMPTAGILRMSAPGANRTCRDRENDVNDPGCVKTLQAVVNAQHKNRACSLGESFMHHQRFARINVALERAAKWFSHSQDPSAISARISYCSSEAIFSPYQSTRLHRYDVVSRGWEPKSAGGIFSVL